MPIATPTAVRRPVWPTVNWKTSLARGAERHAYTDLVRALRNHVRHHAVDTEHREQQRQAAENRA